MLEGYYFDDCLLIDFTATPDLSSIQVVTEVQYVSETDPKGKMGHLKVRLSKLEEVELHLLPGFTQDLDYAYGYKGNEIYEFSVQPQPSGKLRVTLRSDLLTLSATCAAECVKEFLLS